MKIAYYVINLDRSPDRLAAISADAASSGLTLERVPAVDGAAASVETRRRVLDEAGFRRLHGKVPMDGEYGCYASHLDAFDSFLSGDADAAVIFEDDVRPTADFVPVVEAIAAVDDWDLVKLMHHRMPALRSRRRLPGGRVLGLAWFGPTGSSACYLINRRAATILRDKLVPMRLPYDVALERGWALGLRIRHVRPDLVTSNAATKKSLIGGTKMYARARLAPWRRMTTLAFRTSEFLRRATYAALASDRR
ncbi:glycosyl transferase [Aurantimonas aggregata]|uniref:Glycosyl transferase n=1 Tax=Aurantimonas aggregata TaxID=2047720 RepID=A0A6L9MGT3_9HYPH|nr:glycosyltransferase family 25 protein [Aurantimonas aggregata]NDV86921.1 glycosyl transferase [Aurantimonas aggregata]